MSTLQMNVTGKRIARLAQNGEILFHTKDLANIWDIANPNTLRVTLKRYVQNKLIYRMYKGFYSLIPPHTLPPLLLGAKALHRFCYVSTESILTKEGYINHIPSHHTFISNKRYTFSVGRHDFLSRQLDKKYLYNNEGIYEENGVRKATIERAIADMIYFCPKYYFDREPDWIKVNDMQKKLGYPLTPSP